MKLTIYAMLLMVGISSCYAQEILDAEAQIQQAILALPEEFREDATVLGYKNSSELVVIRKGNNDMICLADDPKKDGFSVAGYHNDLEPFMKRGRTLRQEG